MFDAFIVGLVLLGLAVLMQRTFLYPVSLKLKRREQEFKFHEVRDELQLLAIDRVIDVNSAAYLFLLSMSNVAIKNAGVLCVRDIIQMTGFLTKATSEVFCDLDEQDRRVKELAARLFMHFGDMLISNDWIVRLGVFVTRQSWPLLRVFLRIAKVIVNHLDPMRVKAIREAQQCREMSHQLAPS